VCECDLFSSAPLPPPPPPPPVDFGGMSAG